MKHFFVLLVLIPLFNFSFAEDTSDDFKTSGQKLRDQKFTDLEICEMACESKFQGCYKDQIKNGFKCAGEVVVCKNACKKQSGKTR